jgi:hypothetical protein
MKHGPPWKKSTTFFISMTFPKYRDRYPKLKSGFLGAVIFPSRCIKLSVEPYELRIPASWQEEFKSLREQSENDPKKAAELSTMLEEKLKIPLSYRPYEKDLEAGLQKEIADLVFYSTIIA